MNEKKPIRPWTDDERLLFGQTLDEYQSLYEKKVALEAEHKALVLKIQDKLKELHDIAKPPS
jgi:hypothetical protein